MYRAKAYDLPEASRIARGQHVANLLAFQPEERIAQVIQIKSYEDAPYLVLATRKGLVKKTKLTDFDSNRSGGIVAINLRDGDELVGAVLCSADDDLLLVSANGQSIRFSATDEALRPMGRATSGVQGMRFNTDDQLLSLNVVREGTYLLVATSGGYAKRTAIEEYTAQGRGGKGILTIQYDTRRGRLVGALIVDDDSEVYAITSGGGVIRTAPRQVRKAGRQTKGVRLMNLGEGDTLLAIARNAEEAEPITDEDRAADPTGATPDRHREAGCTVKEPWVTSPNEPGHSGPGDSPNGRTARLTQAAHAAGRRRAHRAGEPTGARAVAAHAAAPRPWAAGDRPARSGRPRCRRAVNRFISGTAAPRPSQARQPPAAEPARGSARRSDEPARARRTPANYPTCPDRYRVAHNGSRPTTGRTTRDGPVRSEGRVQGLVAARGPVRASMQIRRIDPWSTLKVSLVLSVALFFVWMIAVAFLYLVLGGMGVWSKLNSNVGDLLTNTSGSRRAGLQRHDLRRRGVDRPGEHRAADRDGHHRRVHLQPDDRPDRRRRGDAGRPGLAFWARPLRCGNLVARPCTSTGL